MIWFDLESYSEVPIKHGVYKYAENAEVMIITYAFDDGPVQCWDITADREMPRDLAYMLRDDDELICAHHSMFDRTVLRYAMRYDIPIHRWRDTMVKALAHSLPGSLDKLCAILKIPQDKQKLKAGKELIQLFCKPRPKNSKLRRATRDTHPVEWKRFLEYAVGDIEAMRAIDKKLPSWNYCNSELALWHLDQRINDRGVALDLGFARSAITAIDKAQAQLSARTKEATQGAVGSTTQRDQLLAHILEEYGVALPDMRASTLERRIEDNDLPAGLKELLQIRLQASTTSTSKYAAMLRAVNSDGRIRGLLQFCGAQRTGRWSGRTVQPQNFPRPNLEQDEIDFGIEAIKADGAHLIYDNVMELTSNTLRGALVAPPGRKLVSADLKNIEGRVAAWLAGEQWKLDAYAAFDRGEGEDLYVLAYARSFGVDPSEVDHDQRQIGKVMELAFGYGGGVGAWLSFSLAYGIDLEALGEKMYDELPEDFITEAESFYDYSIKKKRPTFGLSRKAFVVCDAIKRGWREAHPKIAGRFILTPAGSYVIDPNEPGMWYGLERDVRGAIWGLTETRRCHMLKAQRKGDWLGIRLPSNRTLCYPNPTAGDVDDYVTKVAYMGVNQYTRGWSRIGTYGGKLFENVCQAVARDVMAANMPRIEEMGYEILLTEHDAVLVESPDSEMRRDAAEDLSELLATNPAWADGLPLAAEGFEAYRFRKA